MDPYCSRVCFIVVQRKLEVQLMKQTYINTADTNVFGAHLLEMLDRSGTEIRMEGLGRGKEQPAFAFF